MCAITRENNVMREGREVRCMGELERKEKGRHDIIIISKIQIIIIFKDANIIFK